MSSTGTVRAPQPIPDPNRLRPEIGQGQSNPTFPLRSTPPVYRALVVGGNNSNVDLGLMRSAIIPDFPIPPTLLASRFHAGARPVAGITVEFETQIAGTGGVASAGIAVARSFATTITGLGSVVANNMRTRPFATSISGSSSVVADQSGGTLGSGGLILTPETGDQTLTLTEETGDSQTLTNEDPPDSLTITPA